MANRKDKTEEVNIEETETVETTAYDPDELVEVFLPRRGVDEQDLFVGVNGENVRIKRGARVKIKRKFADVIDEAERLEEAAYKTIERAQAASKKALADL